jgi:hypothetical protein
MSHPPPRICFHNPVNFGDLFLSSPFVRHICESNPTRIFYYFLHNGDYIFTGSPLPNLVNVLSPEDDYRAYYHIAQHSYPKYREQMTQFVFKGETYIIFNIWCIALGCSTDVKFKELNDGFMKILKCINDTYSDTYLITSIPNDKLMPIVEMPDSVYHDNGFHTWLHRFRNHHVDNTTISGYTVETSSSYSNVTIVRMFDIPVTPSKYNNHTNKLVFIYNYVLRSTTAEYNMNDTIVNLAKLRPHYTFIVPNHSDSFVECSNIVCCSTLFGYSEKDKTFKNVFLLDRIIRECDIIISQECGASWIWFNQNIVDYYKKHGSKSIYITHHHYPEPTNPYHDKMNAWFNCYYNSVNADKTTVSNKPTELVSYVYVHDLVKIL